MRGLCEVFVIIHLNWKILHTGLLIEEGEHRYDPTLACRGKNPVS
jgi:hypothetical protein